MAWTVMTVWKIDVGHKSDVTFPSDVPYDSKEEIILPAQLFKRKGMTYIGKKVLLLNRVI